MRNEIGTSEATLMGLLDDVYEAGLDAERWPVVLNRVADSFGARDAALGTIGPPGLSWMCAPRTDPDFLACYPERFHHLNHAWHRIVARGVGASTTDTMVIERPAFRRSTYYNEWARPQGYHTVLGGLIDAEETWRTVLTLPGRADYQPRQVELFRTLSSHIRRAVRLNHRLERAHLDRGAVRHTLEQMRNAAWLVDAEARVLRMNGAAETLLAAERGLCVRKGRLCATRRDADVALQAVIARAARQSLADTSATLRVPAANGQGCNLSVILLHRRVPISVPKAAAALVIDVSAPPAREEPARLCDSYGLTPAEARFAAEILKGDGKRAAAERCGISYATARTHLSRIFEKTGVHRQAELIRLFKG